MMKLTEEKIATINEALLKLDPNKEFEIEISELKIGEEEIILFFPRDEINISVYDLLKYLPEFESIQFSQARVTSNRFTQIPVYSFEKPIDYIITEINFSVDTPNYKMRLVENPILIGIAATKLGIYDKYALPCSSYIGLEIEYQSSENRLSEENELKLVKSFLFELSYISKSSINFNIIHESGAFDEYEEPEKQNIILESLNVYSEGMDLFRKALNSTDEEITFLYFYKIIEYYSPIAARISAYENLSKKIVALKYNNPTNQDLLSIFSIADKFRVSLLDKELAQILLNSSIDIIELFPKLPIAIRKKISKNLHFNETELNYNIKNEILLGIITTVGTILYSTRNSIVHAKSNYKSDSNECNAEDLSILNEFLNAACYSIINWYNRLPDHLKFE